MAEQAEEEAGPGWPPRMWVDAEALDEVLGAEAEDAQVQGTDAANLARSLLKLVRDWEKRCDNAFMRVEQVQDAAAKAGTLGERPIETELFGLVAGLACEAGTLELLPTDREFRLRTILWEASATYACQVRPGVDQQERLNASGVREMIKAGRELKAPLSLHGEATVACLEQVLAEAWDWMEKALAAPFEQLHLLPPFEAIDLSGEYPHSRYCAARQLVEDATAPEEHEESLEASDRKRRRVMAKEESGGERYREVAPDEDMSQLCLCHGIVARDSNASRKLIACSICETWYHLSCVGLLKERERSRASRKAKQYGYSGGWACIACCEGSKHQPYRHCWPASDAFAQERAAKEQSEREQVEERALACAKAAKEQQEREDAMRREEEERFQAMLASSKKGCYYALDDETPSAIAAKLRIPVSDILKLNARRYPGLSSKAQLCEQTELVIPIECPPEYDNQHLWTVEEEVGPDIELVGEGEDEGDWVCCERCETWRKLPDGVDPANLPEIWECGMEPLPCSRCGVEDAPAEGSQVPALAQHEESIPKESVGQVEPAAAGIATPLAAQPLAQEVCITTQIPVAPSAGVEMASLLPSIDVTLQQ